MTATDGMDPAIQLFEWSVSDTNRPPVWSDPGPQAHDEDESVSLQLQASDPDLEDVVSYDAPGLPEGLSLDSGSGWITGEIGYQAADDGPVYAITATATDGEAIVELALGWTVTDQAPPPQVPTLPGSILLGIAALLGASGLWRSRRRASPSERRETI